MINFIRGTVVLFLLLISIIIFSTLIVIFASIANILPFQTWRHHGHRFAMNIPLWWNTANHFILQLSTHNKWDVQGTDNLDPKGWYLLISNHTSWLDILVLNNVFNYKIPLIKFFMKRELLWSMPIAGLACYSLGYPFMHRHTRAEIKKNPKLKGKDLETTKKACEKFKAIPTTVMNFVEGTRFTEEKKQQSRSPYQNLLKPKTAGIAIVLNEMAEKLNGILNVTIHYEMKEFSFWQIACGNIDKITVRYEILPVTENLIGDYYKDRGYRKDFQQWLNTIWERKDQLLKQLKSSGQTS